MKYTKISFDKEENVKVVWPNDLYKFNWQWQFPFRKCISKLLGYHTLESRADISQVFFPMLINTMTFYLVFDDLELYLKIILQNYF